MTQEEKAKRYDEALVNARQEYNTTENVERKQWLEELFPELKEPKDEQIRKDIIKMVTNTCKGEWFINSSKEECLSWLEKQGEKKHVSITDEWIEDYWQHEKVNNPYSYDKGDEIQFDHQGFVRFCKKYCQKPTNKIEPKPAWSEEDEKTLNEIFSVAARASLRKSTLFGISYDYIKWQNWLKSLRPQNRWKPSDEQMKVLISEVEGWTKGCPKQKVLESLYNDLKNLK